MLYLFIICIYLFYVYLLYIYYILYNFISGSFISYVYNLKNNNENHNLFVEISIFPCLLF